MTSFKVYTHQCLETYNRCFSWQQNLSTCLLEWDSVNTKFSKRPGSKPTQKFRACIWRFNVFVVAGLIGLGSCLHVILNVRSTEVSPQLVVLATGFAAISVIIWGTAWFAIMDIDEITSGFCALQDSKQLFGNIVFQHLF